MKWLVESCAVNEYCCKHVKQIKPRTTWLFALYRMHSLAYLVHRYPHTYTQRHTDSCTRCLFKDVWRRHFNWTQCNFLFFWIFHAVQWRVCAHLIEIVHCCVLCIRSAYKYIYRLPQSYITRGQAKLNLAKPNLTKPDQHTYPNKAQPSRIVRFSRVLWTQMDTNNSVFYCVVWVCVCMW